MSRLVGDGLALVTRISDQLAWSRLPNIPAKTTAALCDFLRPRHDALRRLGNILPCLDRLSQYDATQQRVLGIRSAYLHEETTAHDELLQCAEAVHVLSLLAQHDVHAWRNELKTIWPSERVEKWVDGELTTLVLTETMVMGVEFRVQSSDDLTRLTLSPPDARHSDEFNAVVSETKKNLKAVPVQLELEYEERPSDELAMALAAIVAIADTHRPDGQILQLTHVRHSTMVSVELNLAGLCSLEQLVQKGVSVYHLPHLHVDDSLETAVVVARALQTVLQVGGSPHRGVHTAMVSDITSPHLFPALLSAIQHSESVRNLEIQIGDYYDGILERMRRWELVAYCLFSRHAAHAIERLVWHLEAFRDEYAKCIGDVLDLSNPHSVFRDQELDVNSENEQAAASRFYLADPFEESDPETSENDEFVFVSERPLTVRFLDRPGDEIQEWFGVLLPGRGRAWVHAQDLRVENIRVPDCRRPASFEEITIDDMNDDSMDLVNSLLARIADETRTLSLVDFNGAGSLHAWYNEALRMCPKLEKFEAALFSELAAIVESADSGYCRLKALSISYVCSDAMDDAARFFSTLCDPTHPLSVHLEKIQPVICVDEANVQELVDCIVGMLKTNRHLQRISLGFRLATKNGKLWHRRSKQHWRNRSKSAWRFRSLDFRSQQKARSLALPSRCIQAWTAASCQRFWKWLCLVERAS